MVQMTKHNYVDNLEKENTANSAAVDVVTLLFSKFIFSVDALHIVVILDQFTPSSLLQSKLFIYIARGNAHAFN